MELLTDKMMSVLKESLTVRPLEIGDDARLSVSPMIFNVSRFEIEGVGNLSLLHARALAGLMRMETFILTPLMRDAPLFSVDYISALGSDTLLVEWYDTNLSPIDEKSVMQLTEPCRLMRGIREKRLGARWYDEIKLSASRAYRARGCGRRCETYLEAAARAYCALLKDAPIVDAEAKKKRTGEYVDGLFENGGPSTDAFSKALGQERARALFYNVIFGIDKH